MSSGKKQGLYVSYNEGKNGPFDEAVRISNELGCLTWLDKSRVDPRHLIYPTEIFVRLKGAERYFRGTLLAIASRDALHEDFRSRGNQPSAYSMENGKRLAAVGCGFPVRSVHRWPKSNSEASSA